MQLDSVATAKGVRLEPHATVGSTNAEALVRARGGDLGPLWITAQRQTAGRGRRGRTWVSEPGNLYATLLLTDPAPVERAAELSFVAALAVHDAITELAPGLAGRLALKWPNDVLVDGAKVAGILLESEGEAGRPLAVAVGIGVNCTHHPDGTPYPAIDLASVGAPIAPEHLFAALSCTMVERLTQWDRARGFAAIRADWLARAAGVGEAIRVALGDRELEGRFEALDSAGHLVLRLGDGSVTAITAGDVFSLAPSATTAPSRTSA
jgi:BirA family transcriptional regulator, biotin operon repressor / biotin---[acetyl-CoA-carboxylase] ligase